MNIMPALQILSLVNLSIFQLLITSVFCLFLIWYAKFHWNRRRMYELAGKVPGPITYPIIGMGHVLLNRQAVFLDVLSECFKKWPHIVRAWFGPQLMYAVSKPEYLEHILKNHYDRGELFWKFSRPIFGCGLVNASVDQWKKNRKIINPAFNQRSLDAFVKSFADNGDIFVDKIKIGENKSDWDIYPPLVACMADIISETIFGVTINAQKHGKLEFAEWFDELVAIFYTRTCNLFYQFDFIFDRTNMAIKLRHYVSKLHCFTSKIIKEKQEEFENNAKNDETEYSIDKNPKAKKSLLSLLMELGQKGEKFTDQELKDEINTMAHAGTDTTSTGMCFFFMALGICQDVQQKIYDEIIEVVGDRQITSDDLPQLKYLEKAIKESLRLFPPVPLSLRAITEEINLGEYTLAVGGYALLCLLETHRSPLYWKNPLVFDPERFSPEETAKRHPFSHIPFGGGARNCIGLKFTTMVMKTLTATLIKKYKLKCSHKSIEDIKLETVALLRPSDGFKVVLEKRT